MSKPKPKPRKTKKKRVVPKHIRERRARRRALSDWAKAVAAAGVCAVCGRGPGTTVVKRGKRKGKAVKVSLQAHHLLPKERYPEFRTEPINGILLCPRHHKYDRYSFHRNPFWSMLWLRRHRPEQYAWCREHVGRPPKCQTPETPKTPLSPR